MAAHSEIGASSADRWMNCPASVRLSRGMPNTTSRAAEEGTAAHALGEYCLRDPNRNPSDYLGMWIDQDGAFSTDFEGSGWYEVNQDMVDAVTIYVDYARKMIRENNVKHVMIEKGFHLKQVDEGAFGTNDLSLYTPGKYLHIIDYKHGKGKVVEVVDNPQIMYYGLGAIDEICEDEFDVPLEIHLTIVQPRARHRDGPIRTHVVQAAEIDVQFRRTLKAAIARTKDENEEPVTGSYCFFCRAKAVCPAKRKEYFDTGFLDLDPSEMGMELERVKAGASEKTIEEILAVKDDLIDWLEAVQTYATSRAVEHGEIPEGFELRPKKTNRKLVNTENLIAEIRGMGKDVSKFLKPPSLVALGQLEKDADIKALLNDPETKDNYIVKPEGQPELVKK